MSRLGLLHLSDIHLNRQHALGWDPDAELRHELVDDVRRLVSEGTGVSGVIVTGDVAFSGAAHEYEDASSLLQSICSAAGCPNENVWMVPGNHDVDRGKLDKSVLLSSLHYRVRSAVDDELDDVLEELLTDPEAGPVLLSPLHAYNTFAARYECAISPTQPYWEDTLPLKEPYRLRLRGLTTVLVSNGNDDDANNRLAVGRMQCRFLRAPGVVTMVLGHHPSSWLRHRDALEEALRPHARVQAWGHRHVRRATMVDDNVHLYAGAVHPERREAAWSPQYNVLQLSMELTGTEASLVVEIRPRRWFPAEGRFGPDVDASGKEAETFTLSLGAPVGVAMEPTAGPSPDKSYKSQAEGQDAPPVRIARPARRLAYRFSELPYQVRVDIARQVGLLPDHTPPIPDHELFSAVLGNARSDEVRAKLWDAVEARHPEPDSAPNPYREEVQ